jgi:hypothetical protein
MLTGHEFSGSISTEPVQQPQEEANRSSPLLSLMSQKDSDDIEASTPGFLDWLFGWIAGLAESEPQQPIAQSSQSPKELPSLLPLDPLAELMSQPIDLPSFDLGSFVAPVESDDIFSSFINPTLPDLW